MSMDILFYRSSANYKTTMEVHLLQTVRKICLYYSELSCILKQATSVLLKMHAFHRLLFPEGGRKCNASFIPLRTHINFINIKLLIYFLNKKTENSKILIDILVTLLLILKLICAALSTDISLFGFSKLTIISIIKLF